MADIQLDIPTIIAANIRDLRKSKGMTQGDLAAKLGYTVQAISRWEKAKSMPDPAMLYRLAVLFEVDVSYFYQSNHIEIDPEQEKALKRRETLFRVVLGLSFVFVLALLAVVIIFFIDPSITDVSLWILSFLVLAILVFAAIMRFRRIVSIFIPIIIVVLTTTLFFTLKDYVANLKFIFIPMVVLLIAYFAYTFLLNRRK